MKNTQASGEKWKKNLADTKTHRLVVGAGLRDPELVVGDDPEVVGGLRVEVLVADGVVLHRAAASPDFRLPLVHVWNFEGVLIPEKIHSV